MECKSYKSNGEAKDFNELIDTLWNVNTDDSVAIKANKTELIDTLWNVNATDCTVAGSFARELIDTLWNVNTYMLMMSDARTSN